MQKFNVVLMPVAGKSQSTLRTIMEGPTSAHVRDQVRAMYGDSYTVGSITVAY